MIYLKTDIMAKTTPEEKGDSKTIKLETLLYLLGLIGKEKQKELIK